MGPEGERLRVFSSRVDAIFRGMFEEASLGLEYRVSLEDVRADRWDVPGRTYIWRAPLPDVSNRSVQYQLLSNRKTEYALLGASAWLDVGSTSDSSRTRFWCHTPSRRAAPWYVRVGPAATEDFVGGIESDVASQRIASALVEVTARVMRWRFVERTFAWEGDDIVREEPVSFPATSGTRPDA